MQLKQTCHTDLPLFFKQAVLFVHIYHDSELSSAFLSRSSVDLQTMLSHGDPEQQIRHRPISRLIVQVSKICHCPDHLFIPISVTFIMVISTLVNIQLTVPMRILIPTFVTILTQIQIHILVSSLVIITDS